MIDVVLLGTGNVATHLFDAFSKSTKVNVTGVYGRTAKKLHYFSKTTSTTTQITQLPRADVYVIAVTDNAIAELANQITLSDKLVVHTSGSVGIDTIISKKAGVFYPLQTFSKNVSVDFSEIPICLEATRIEDLHQLHELAKAISNTVRTIDSKQRKSLHLAAVFVCNFVNHLYDIGHHITQEHQLPFDILKPLIRETARKIESGTPASLQTGPAKRNDTGTIDQHLRMLSNKTQHKLYKLLTKSIQQNTNNYE